MTDKVFSKYDVMTVGELPHTPDPEQVLGYVDAKHRQLNMVFQFDLVDLGQGKILKYISEEYTLPDFKHAVGRWQDFVDGTNGWTTVFAENHDQGRSISRFASDVPEYRSKSGKLLAMLLASLTGTLYIYQGQEIGMVNILNIGR